MKIITLFLLLATASCGSPEPTTPAPQADTKDTLRHVKVYYEPGKYGGWPANFGIWSWGDEILVGFLQGLYKDLGDRHHINREHPEYHLLARSLDGGETWSIEDPGAKGQLLTDGGYMQGVLRTDVTYPELMEPEGGIDFTHPDFALAVRTNEGPGIGRFFYSYDRGKNWKGPYRLPNFGRIGTSARTDYIVNGRDDCMIFITAAKLNGRSGRPMCARTTDGGRTWNLLSWIGPEPKGSAIMPSSARLSQTDILVAVRAFERPRYWQSVYLSQDNGQTWQYLNDPVPPGNVDNPPALLKLRDGRVCLIYGHRAEPFSIRAKLSSDGGRTWSDDIVLRDNGANKDMGYVRAAQRPDGKVVVVYYFNDLKTGPERYIGATLWDPNSANAAN